MSNFVVVRIEGIFLIIFCERFFSIVFCGDYIMLLLFFVYDIKLGFGYSVGYIFFFCVGICVG